MYAYICENQKIPGIILWSCFNGKHGMALWYGYFLASCVYSLPILLNLLLLQQKPLVSRKTRTEGTGKRKQGEAKHLKLEGTSTASKESWFSHTSLLSFPGSERKRLVPFLPGGRKALLPQTPWKNATTLPSCHLPQTDGLPFPPHTSLYSLCSHSWSYMIKRDRDIDPIPGMAWKAGIPFFIRPSELRDRQWMEGRWGLDGGRFHWMEERKAWHCGACLYPVWTKLQAWRKQAAWWYCMCYRITAIPHTWALCALLNSLPQTHHYAAITLLPRHVARQPCASTRKTSAGIEPSILMSSCYVACVTGAVKLAWSSLLNSQAY